ncbi:Carboxylesterase [Dictyocaulus viviparus]|uniref:Carboxylesterase n=1 Tax=Dictyocaulus viviparus TaxID=29172 RepID=A0A0D8XQ23_DICVI|nr:Carboxylesterase [Dictyocaulus viviparus]
MGHGQSHRHPEEDSRVVNTKYGQILGRRFTFDKRQKPEPPEPWENVRETKKFAPRSIQKDMFIIEKTLGGYSQSEDCLYLNVFAPVWSPQSSTGFAVLVFIHGGGFVSDSTVKYGDVGICEHLCTKEVIVVTVQYRVGYLGFFSTGDEHCYGNFALWDQTLALKWIQDNISFFNGDPTNVTVMGQSAGGASVDLLSICPHSRG